MGRIFGTDGVRGLANQTLDCSLAYRIGQEKYVLIVKEFSARSYQDSHRKDTRISGDMLEAALVAGMCSVGVDVVEEGFYASIAYLVKLWMQGL